MIPANIPNSLLKQLRHLPKTHRYWVAYSGGADSHALLHIIHGLRDRLVEVGTEAGAEIAAIHVNHGLHPDAGQWAHHASGVCRGLEIPCRILPVHAHPAPGQSPEAVARSARYHAMGAMVGTDEILLTAHHLDDQAETVLLQLIRGAGPRGLAAMPVLARFGVGYLARPLLQVPRRAIREYAEAHGLSWIEDTSNDDPRFGRNYLRHEILPRLQTRWPAIAHTLGRAAAHQAGAAQQLDRLAEEDLAALHGGNSPPTPLSCEALRRLPEYRRRNVLMAWFRHLGLPAPNAIHIQRILADVIHAAPDAKPLARWKGVEVRRYRDEIHAAPPLPRHDPSQVIHWPLEEPLSLPHGQLMAERVSGEGLRAAALPGNTVEVRFRQGGERCRMAAHGHHQAHHRPLKKLFQEWGIPPWARDRIPLIFVDGELAAVAGLRVCGPFAAGSGEKGWAFTWRGAPIH